MGDRQVFIRERLRALAGAFLIIGILGAAAALVVGDGESVTRVHFSNWVQRNYSLLRTVTNAGLYPFYFLFIGLFLYGHWRGERAYKLLAQGYLIAQLLGGVLLVRILKMTLGRARPDATPLPGFESDWIGFTWDAKFHSFPSGHSADIVTSAIFAALLFRSPWAAALCVAWAVSLGLTRLAVAKHYPSDALAGAAIALVVSLLVVRYWLLPRLEAISKTAARS